MPGTPVHVSATRTLSAPPDAVWETVALGFGHVATYNPAIDRSEYLGEQREGVGTARLCHVAPKGYLKETITAWEPGEAFELEVTETSFPMASVRSRFTFAPEGDGTRLTQDFWYRMKAPFGPLSVLMKRSMRNTLETGLDGLGAHLEAAL